MESSKQGNIGRPADGPAPKEVDYDMWLGSAPSDPLTQTAFMADGGGFMITVVAIWVMTVYIG